MITKIHALKWTGTREIDVKHVYISYHRASAIARGANSKRSWFNRMCGDRWVVQTLSVKH